jgi:IS30 family transposase
MSQLSYEQRYTIEVLLNYGQSHKVIARVLSIDKSLISREIKRNCDGRSLVYKAKLTQSKYESRQHLKQNI